MSMKKDYIYSLGVIINKKNGDYLYAVVADTGKDKRGMGEVSIYAAWKMKGITPPKNHVVYPKHKIANQDQTGKWKIVLFQKSAPKGKKDGWHYKTTKALRGHLKSVGKKCYKGTGKCLN